MSGLIYWLSVMVGVAVAQSYGVKLEDGCRVWLSADGQRLYWEVP